MEDEKERVDFVVSRAVMTLPELVKRIRKHIDNTPRNAVANGLICLKGGDLKDEIAPFRQQVIHIDLKDYFSESFFDTKKLIYMPL